MKPDLSGQNLANPYLAAGFLLSVSLFILDIFTPPKFALSVIPHLFAVVMATPTRWPVGPWLIAALASVFCMVGWAIKSPDLADELFLINRLTIVVLLFLMAWLVMKLMVFREGWLARDAAELESRRKSIFLASVSHHFRSPLNAIIGFSEVIRDQFFGPDAHSKYREYAHDIQSAGMDLLAIVEDLIALAEFEAGLRKVAKERTSIPHLLNECIEMAARTKQGPGIEFSVDAPHNMPPFLVDPNLLRRVFKDLLTNAVDAMSPLGKIAISATEAGGRLRINIADTGPGISPDRLLWVRQPFSRGHYDPMIAQDGVGLGLAIAKALVEAHAGILKIDSELGKGTVVTIEIPTIEIPTAEFPAASA